MKYHFAILFSILLASCSIQPGHDESDLSIAAEQERAGDIKAAEKTYASAVARSKSHLTAKDTSAALYDMGAFYRRHGNYPAAIKTLKDSIAYASEAGAFDELELGRRYVDLAASYAELGNFNDGAVYLKKLTPFWSRYSGNELSFVKAVFTLYRSNLAAAGVDASFIPEAALIKIDRYSKPQS